MPLFKNWKVINNKSPKTSEEAIDILLENRNLTEEAAKNEFLNPIHPDEFNLEEIGIEEKQVEKAIERIKLAKKERQKVVVFGDYDVDGICATAIMWETLHKAGIDVMPFIPNRFVDGYGLKPAAIDKLLLKYPDLKLIITVDNGIVAHDAVKHAAENNIDIIISDHHTKDKTKNKALSVVHSTKICGAAVSYFFAKEINKSLRQAQSKHLELAAMGTISDQMPLISINRSIVKFGLRMLSMSQRLGLNTLIDQTVSDSNKVSTYDINFKIGPRINAAGRIDEGLIALQLLCTKDKKRSEKLALQLNELNTKRQEIVKQVVESAKAKVEDEDKLIVIWGENLHEGVIGLAASKLVEKFYRPSIVLSVEGDKAKASARSVSGFNIIEAIRELDDLLIEGGGHEMAAGFSIYTNKLEEFRSKINNLNKEKLTEKLLTPSLIIDTKINFDLFTLDFWKKLEKFEPYGTGNFSPVFVTEGARITEIKTVGQENKHLKLKFSQNSVEFDTIAFNMGFLAIDLHTDLVLDIAYNLDLNVWNGRRSLQLKLKDLRASI